MGVTYDTETGTYKRDEGDSEPSSRYARRARARGTSRRGDEKPNSKRVAGFAARAAWEVGKVAYDQSGWFKWMVRLLFVGLCVGIFIVAKMNIQPYYSMLSAGREGGGWISHLPGVGHLMRAIGSLIIAIGAFFIWGAVQICQCLWLIVRLDRKAKMNAVIRSNAIQKQIGTNHQGRTKKIAQGAAGVPYFFIRWSGIISLAAYAFDMALGLGEYPLASSTQELFFALNSGMIDRLDMVNFRNLLSMMFFFECLLFPTIIVWQWLTIRDREEMVDE